MPVIVRIPRFCQKLKSPQNMLFFLQCDCFHDRTKFWMFQINWKGIFIISKNTQNQPKNGHAGNVRIQRFCQKLKSPRKHAFFSSNRLFSWKNKILNVFGRIGMVFSICQKIFKINQKMATPVRSGYSDFAKNWKIPKTCFFFFKPIVFMKEQNFECFRRIGRVFSLFQKILKINQKIAMPVRSGHIDFGPNIEKYPKHAFFFFKLIVFMREQNFECFT